MSSASRRRLALVLSLLMVGSVVAVSVSGLTVTPTAGTGVLDGDEDERRLTHAHAAADPALSGHGVVVHLTSHDTETGDYAMTVVDIVDVDRLVDIDTLEFDYYEGSDNSDAAPDEVWLVIENDTGRYIVFRTFNDGTVFGAEKWKTQSVAGAIEHSDRPWVEVDNAEGVEDPREVLENLSEDNLTEVGKDLREVYGTDASLLAVGVGHGAPLAGPTTVDLYVDNLEVNGDTYKFPVASVNVKPDPLEKGAEGTECVASTASDCVNATIDIGGYWAANSVHDLNVSTIRLNGTEVVDGSAITKDFDGDGKDELRVQFKKAGVEDDLPEGEDVAITLTAVFDDDATGLSATDHVDVVA